MVPTPPSNTEPKLLPAQTKLAQTKLAQTKLAQTKLPQTKLPQTDLTHTKYPELIPFLQHCQENHIKITAQRQAVYRELLLSRDHPIPENIYLRVRKQHQAISLATVYKILDFFHQHGLVRKLFGDQAIHYDADTKPHQHFICNTCMNIQDIHLKPSQLTEYNPPNYKTLSVDIYFRGLCPQCHSEERHSEERHSAKRHPLERHSKPLQPKNPSTV